MSMTDTLSIEDVVDRIICLNAGLADFWSRSHGWAPIDAASLLSKSRLDWQVSLSRSLRNWITPPAFEDEAAHQILGYANIGALVEGSLKLFLSVWYNDYAADTIAIKRNGVVEDPDVVCLEPLRQFFKKRIWDRGQPGNWDPWIERIQFRRNAIHAFKDRDIGTHDELLTDIRNYLKFLRRINGQLPYPDCNAPCEVEDWDVEWAVECDAPTLSNATHLRCKNPITSRKRAATE